MLAVNSSKYYLPISLQSTQLCWLMHILEVAHSNKRRQLIAVHPTEVRGLLSVNLTEGRKILHMRIHDKHNRASILHFYINTSTIYQLKSLNMHHYRAELGRDSSLVLGAIVSH